jgi:hypothetical protein
MLGDHVTETGAGHTYTVLLINPVTYDYPVLRDTRTTVPSAMPSLSGIPFPTGLGPVVTQTQREAEIKALALAPKEKLELSCATPAACSSALTALRPRQMRLLSRFSEWNNYALVAYQDVLQAATLYQALASVAAAQSAAAKPEPKPTSLPVPYVECVDEVGQVAQWTLGRRPKSLNGLPDIMLPAPDAVSQNCLGAPKLPSIEASTLFSALGAWQLDINRLRNEIDENAAKFTTGGNPNITAGVNDAATFKTQLTGVDLATYGIAGTAGGTLLKQIQALAPFYDFDAHDDWATINVDCHPYDVDGQSHSITLTAASRLSTTPALVSQPIATIDCPGALALSAGAGVTGVPIVNYQLVTANPTASPPVSTIGRTAQDRQLYGAALVHYFLLPIGNSQTALFGTGGIGTSSQSFAGFTG